MTLKYSEMHLHVNRIVLCLKLNLASVSCIILRFHTLSKYQYITGPGSESVPSTVVIGSALEPTAIVSNKLWTANNARGVKTNSLCLIVRSSCIIDCSVDY